MKLGIRRQQRLWAFLHPEQYFQNAVPMRSDKLCLFLGLYLCCFNSSLKNMQRCTCKHIQTYRHTPAQAGVFQPCEWQEHRKWRRFMHSWFSYLLMLQETQTKHFVSRFLFINSSPAICTERVSVWGSCSTFHRWGLAVPFSNALTPVSMRTLLVHAVPYWQHPLPWKGSLGAGARWEPCHVSDRFLLWTVR